MNTVTVVANPFSMLPLYACIFTSALLTLVLPLAQRKIQAVAALNSTSLARRIVATRAGSGLLLVAGAFALLMGEVFLLVSLTGGSFA